jgi:hypothetical protein
LFSEAIPRLIESGWLEEVELQIPDSTTSIEIPQDGAVIPQDCAESPHDLAPRARAHALPFPSVPSSSIQGGTGGKRLHGIPATVQEVIDYGASLHPPVTPGVCTAFWSYYEGQARTSPSGELFWITSGEAVVTNWRAKLPTFGQNGLGGSVGGNGNGRPDHRAERAAKEYPEPPKKMKML